MEVKKADHWNTQLPCRELRWKEHSPRVQLTVGAGHCVRQKGQRAPGEEFWWQV